MARNKVLVRPAIENDSPHIFRLILELAHYEKAPEEVVNTEVSLVLHGFKIQPPLFYAWVAEDSEAGIVGMAFCYVRYSTWKGPVLYLEDIVVTENYRRQGIGKELYKACLEFARKQGYKRMTWQVLDWNEPAIAFYRKEGASFDNGWVNVTVNTGD